MLLLGTHDVGWIQYLAKMSLIIALKCIWYPIRCSCSSICRHGTIMTNTHYLLNSPIHMFWYPHFLAKLEWLKATLACWTYVLVVRKKSGMIKHGLWILYGRDARLYAVWFLLLSGCNGWQNAALRTKPATPPLLPVAYCLPYIHSTTMEPIFSRTRASWQDIRSKMLSQIHESENLITARGDWDCSTNSSLLDSSICWLASRHFDSSRLSNFAGNKCDTIRVLRGLNALRRDDT